jgi:hypothetical protein
MKNPVARVRGCGRGLRTLLAASLAFCLGIFPALPKDKLTSIPPGNWGLVGVLDEGTSISVRMTSGDRIDGKFIALDPDSVRLVMDKKERIYPRIGIAEIWQLRAPDPKLNGSLIGMGVGAVAGIIGAVASNAPFGGEDAWGSGFVMAGIGIGAALGFAADAAIKSDKLIYRK